MIANIWQAGSRVSPASCSLNASAATRSLKSEAEEVQHFGTDEGSSTQLCPSWSLCERHGQPCSVGRVIELLCWWCCWEGALEVFRPPKLAKLPPPYQGDTIFTNLYFLVKPCQISRRLPWCPGESSVPRTNSLTSFWGKAEMIICCICSAARKQRLLTLPSLNRSARNAQQNIGFVQRKYETQQHTARCLFTKHMWGLFTFDFQTVIFIENKEI
jgi:hypothetical protein